MRLKLLILSYVLLTLSVTSYARESSASYSIEPYSYSDPLKDFFSDRTLKFYDESASLYQSEIPAPLAPYKVEKLIISTHKYYSVVEQWLCNTPAKYFPALKAVTINFSGESPWLSKSNEENTNSSEVNLQPIIDKLGQIKELKTLRLLNASSNPIKEVKLDRFPNLIELQLRGISFTESCLNDFKNLEELILENPNQKFDFNQITSTAPQSLKKLVLNGKDYSDYHEAKAALEKIKNY